MKTAASISTDGCYTYYLVFLDLLRFWGSICGQKIINPKFVVTQWVEGNSL